MRTSRDGRSTPALAWTLALVLVLAVGLAWEGGWMNAMTGDTFDAQQWQAARGTTDDPNPRAGMLSALEEGHLRKGMTRAAVRRLLGEPDASTPSEDEYDLGRSQVGVTFESYVIEYDAEGRVESLRLRRR